MVGLLRGLRGMQLIGGVALHADVAVALWCAMHAAIRNDKTSAPRGVFSNLVSSRSIAQRARATVGPRSDGVAASTGDADWVSTSTASAIMWAALPRGGTTAQTAAHTPADVALAYAVRCWDRLASRHDSPAPVSHLPLCLLGEVWPWTTDRKQRVIRADTGGDAWSKVNATVTQVLLEHLRGTTGDVAARKAVSKLRRSRSLVGAKVVTTTGERSLCLLRGELSSILVLACVSPPRQLASLARAVGKLINQQHSCEGARAMVIQVRWGCLCFRSRRQPCSRWMVCDRRPCVPWVCSSAFTVRTCDRCSTSSTMHYRWCVPLTLARQVAWAGLPTGPA